MVTDQCFAQTNPALTSGRRRARGAHLPEGQLARCYTATRSAAKLPERHVVPKYDDIIVDTGAGDNIEQEAATSAVADCAIAPLQPSRRRRCDHRGLVMTPGWYRLQKLNPELRAWALLNRASTSLAQPRRTGGQRRGA